MRKFTITLSTIAFIASPTFADDKTKHNEAFTNNFDGPYLGVELGLGANVGRNSGQLSGLVLDSSITPIPIEMLTLTGRNGQTGILGGLNAGWNWALPRHSEAHWLVGLDFFADVANIKTSNTSAKAIITRGLTLNQSLSHKTNMKWGIGAGAKFGMIIENVLLFTTVHWVGSQFNLKGSFNIGVSGSAPVFFATAKERKFLSGVRAGLGFEMPVSNHVKLGMNAGYSWYQDIKKRANIIVTTLATTNGTVKFKSTPNVMDVKATMAWAFNGIS